MLAFGVFDGAGACVGEGAYEGAEPDPEPEPAESPQAGVKLVSPLAAIRFLPGFGNWMSKVSLVVHADFGFAMLATNISGRDMYNDSEVSLPPMVIGAQFMYISRFPILLNQVL